VSKFYGSLEGIDLLQSTRLLSQLHATGCLRVSQDAWVGEIVFEGGRVIAASMGAQSGVTALTMVLLAMDGGQLAFCDESLPAQRNIDMGANELRAYLQMVGSLRRSQPQSGRSSEGAALADESPSRGESTVSLVLDPDRVADLLGTNNQLGQPSSSDNRDLVQMREAIVALLEHGLIRADAAKLDSAVPAQDKSPVANPSSPAASPVASMEAPPASTTIPGNGYHPEVASGRVRAPSIAAQSPATPEVCPKLGFTDQPALHYSRPVRLHDCFAGPNQIGIPLQEQADLCFTDKFPTCPRYIAATGPPLSPDRDAVSSSRPVTPEQPNGHQSENRGGREDLTGTPPPKPSAEAVVSPGTVDAVVAPSTRIRREASRKVDLSRNGVSAGASVAQQQVRTIRETDRRLPESPTPPGRAVNAPPVPESPVRTFQDHIPDCKSTVSMPGVAPVPRPRPLEPATDDDPEVRPLPASSRRRWRVPELRWIILSFPITLTIVGMLGLAVFLNREEFAWPDIPEQRVPSTTLAASPVAALPTAGPRVEASLSADRGERESPATGLPGDASARSGSASSPAAASSNGSLGGPAALRTLFDERFADNRRGWPSNPQSTGWLADNAYWLLARQASQFVALGAPLTGSLRDVVVTASFRKVGGPPGGGYGVIVRDQGPGPRDGSSQSGRYYVLETSDRGEVGAWRRENDRWIDLLPWTGSETVRQGAGTNQLTVQAIGQRLTFIVNGTQVASIADDVLAEGGVGVFVGGDFNEVALESFRVEVPQ
jgi:hypothetical protein